jgi:hypothetical protein
MKDFGQRAARLWHAAVVCTGLLAVQSVGAHPAAFTLDEIMGAPFPSELVAAPAGRAVAWVYDAQGARNVWVADTPGAAPGHQLTSFSGDEGFNIGDLVWSSDAASLAFTRGGTLEDDAPTNINSTPEGPVPREV